MFDAIVVAGGSARRLDGADKPGIEIGDRTLLDHVLAGVRGAGRVIVVGPPRDTEVEVTWTREDPPGTGPVAALAAGLELVEAHFCAVLAADLPRIAGAVPTLLTSAADVDVAVLVSGGRLNYLAAVWRTDALRAAVDRLAGTDSVAVRELYENVDDVEVEDEDDWGRDCDTWDDVEHARAEELA